MIFLLTAHVILFYCTDPAHQRANGNLKYFEYQLAKQRKAESERSGTGEKEKKQEKREVDGNEDFLTEKGKYEQLCRGEGIRLVSFP